MDELTRSAVAAVPFDDDQQAQRWLDAVHAAGRAAPAESWDAFRPVLREHAAGAGLRDDQQDVFDRYVTEYVADPAGLIADLLTESDIRAALPQPDSGYDEGAWSAYLAENGPAWNGDETTWRAFGEWFLYYADQRGLGVPARQFVAYADNAPDKAAVFAEYGVDVPLAVLDLGEFPVLLELLRYEASAAGMDAFLKDRTGVDMDQLLENAEESR